MARALVWLQDPDTAPPVEVVLAGTLSKGPRSERLRLDGIDQVSPDAAGDFVVDRSKPDNEDAFDAVHTFAVAHLVLELAQDALGRPVAWAWSNKSTDPLTLRPHGATGAVTQYRRKSKSVTFSKPRPFSPGPGEFHQCRSLEVVAHEVGHAVLDGLQPGWMINWPSHPEVGAIHEGFADLVALFLALSRTELTRAVIGSPGALAGSNVLSVVGEALHVASGDGHGKRDLSLRVTVGDALQVTRLVPGFGIAVDHHHYSTVLSGLVYQAVLARFAEEPGADDPDDAPEVLRDVAVAIRGFVFAAMAAAPAELPTLGDVVGGIAAAAGRAGDAMLVGILENAAVNRGIQLT